MNKAEIFQEVRDSVEKVVAGPTQIGVSTQDGLSKYEMRVIYTIDSEGTTTDGIQTIHVVNDGLDSEIATYANKRFLNYSKMSNDVNRIFRHLHREVKSGRVKKFMVGQIRTAGNFSYIRIKKVMNDTTEVIVGLAVIDGNVVEQECFE